MVSHVLEDAYILARSTVDILFERVETVIGYFNDRPINRTLHDDDQLVNAVRSYNTAINAILTDHIPLHSELIEHPRLMAIRKFLRSNGGY
jgi:hypothetical protein